MKYLLAITITLLPSAALAQQFTPQQMLDVMTKSPENRDVRVHDDDCQELLDLSKATPAGPWEDEIKPGLGLQILPGQEFLIAQAWEGSALYVEDIRKGPPPVKTCN